MDFEKRGEGGLCCALRMDMSFGHEGGGDFSLPDYMPEIQRLLYVVPTVLPETKFLSGNVLEMGGTLTYSVLYVGSDGKITCSSLVSEYSADTVLPVSVDNVSEIFTDCEAENTSCRVVAPRMLNIKTRLRSRIMCDEKISAGDEVLGCDEKKAPLDLCASVERLNTPFSSVMRFHGMTTGNVSGEIIIPEGSHTVSCEGALLVTYCEAKADGVFVKGEICFKCLVCDMEGGISCRKTKFPFDITVPVSDIFLPASARAWGRVASVSLSPGETGNGMNVSVEYDIEGEVLIPVETTLCHDAYSTEVESTCDTRECELLAPVCFGVGQFSSSGDYDVKNPLQNSSVIDVTGSVGPLQVVGTDGKLYAAGNVKFKILYGNGEEYSMGEYDMPVRYELPCDRFSDSIELQSRLTASLIQIAGKVVGDKVSVSAELALSYEVLEKKRCRFVTAVRLGKNKPEGAVGSGVKVYYPVAKESLWSVCKKYHASKNHILKVNGIEGDTVVPGKPVIIF